MTASLADRAPLQLRGWANFHKAAMHAVTIRSVNNGGFHGVPGTRVHATGSNCPITCLRTCPCAPGDAAALGVNAICAGQLLLVSVHGAAEAYHWEHVGHLMCDEVGLTVLVPCCDLVGEHMQRLH